MIFDVFPSHVSLPHWKIHTVDEVNMSMVGTKPVFKWQEIKKAKQKENK